MEEEGPDIGYWNYRVMQSEELPEVEGVSNLRYGIHEVYYDENDEPIGHTEEPVELVGEDREILMNDFAAMKQALQKPVLSYDGDEYIEIEEEILTL